jgi:trans-2,3-dihydro-3-hydroxyanthranilate isomerase
MKRRFVTLDVFTDRRFAGNPLAVVLESDGLDIAAMQTIAGEFNLSETVFVLPPKVASHRGALRIFTPKRELPFAGHPTVGAAVLFGCLDGGGEARAMVLEENIGPVSCRVTPAGSGGQATLDCGRRHQLRRFRAELLVGGQRLHLRAGEEPGRGRPCHAQPRRF